MVVDSIYRRKIGWSLFLNRNNLLIHHPVFINNNLQTHGGEVSIMNEVPNDSFQL